MSLVIQKPSRELIEGAASTLMVYGMLRKSVGRDRAFVEWCDILGLDEVERKQLEHVRITLLQDIAKGDVAYDEIDWSGHDEDRRASSSGTVWVQEMTGWFEL